MRGSGSVLFWATCFTVGKEREREGGREGQPDSDIEPLSRVNWRKVKQRTSSISELFSLAPDAVLESFGFPPGGGDLVVDLAV